MKWLCRVRNCLIAAASISVACASNGALAQMTTIANPSPASKPAATSPNASVDTFAQAEPVSNWWFHGTAEAGGRFFLNNPPRNGSSYLNQDSLAKYYEYSRIQPGPFSDVMMSAGSKDGLYQIDVGGENIGYKDQSYYFDWSKAGEHYFNFSWDQSPHLYSTSAQTFYSGLGSNMLTRPWNALTFTVGTAPVGINGSLYQTDIGINRDTAAASYRWTPSDAWDIKADYSHLARTGTQVDGIVGFGNAGGGGSSAVQVPKPVNDTTQNYAVNGEYAGTSAWGKPFTFKMGYNGSQYTDSYSSYLVQNPYTGPFTGTGVGGTGTTGQSPYAQMSLWPSNHVNGVSSAIGAQLPWNSRYAGTVSYSLMQQDAAFIPVSYQQPSLGFTFPSSLNGKVNTILSNNIITTQINPELTSKLTYRYYNFDNETPELFLSNWPSLDRMTTGAGASNESAIATLSPSYTKQNASELLNWRPSREWNFGAEYGFERYTYSREAALVTNENSGKLFADWKPATWFTLRSSVYYSDRRFEDNYNWQANVASWQFPTGKAGWIVSPTYRQLTTDNRERWKGSVAFDVVAFRGLTITPNFKYQDDNYGLNGANQVGLNESRFWSAGIDATYVLNPRTSLMVGYLREQGYQLVYNTSDTNNTGTVTPANMMQTNDNMVINTYIGLVRYAVNDNLDTEVRYSASRGRDNLQLVRNIGLAPTGGQFPEVENWFQRLDATAIYTFDKELVAFFGWKGEVKAKLRYAWERNSVTNWQNDSLAPTGNVGEPTLIYMAYNNPNYNVHMTMASLAFKW